jgi:hypothetical protein
MAFTAGSLGNISHGNNVAIGSNSLRVNATAVNDNTFIGTNSSNGSSSSVAFTGSNSVGIGSGNVMPSLSANNQVQFWVGGLAGYNVLTRFTGGQWLINNTTSAVTSATASAALEINGTAGGFLPPRMTTAEKNAISSPAAGLIVYDTTLNKLCVFTGAVWETITSL